MRSRDGTIAAAIEASRRELAASSPTPALDARVLAGHALGMDASALIAYGENLIDAASLGRLRGLVRRRKAGEPVAYLVGSKEFYGLRIEVDRRVLVPRPETELLVETVTRDWRGHGAAILDLGTGSGAIACALATALPDVRIIAVDASADALDVARGNVDRLGLAAAVVVRHGDLFDAVADERPFDAIVANLPYVAEDDGDLLDAGVWAHEPAAALFAGIDGLDVYRRMLGAAPGRLAAGGALYLEAGPRNARVLADLAAAAFPDATVELTADLAGRERMVAVRRGTPWA